MPEKITIVHYKGEIANTWANGSYHHNISGLNREGVCKFDFAWRYAKVIYHYHVTLTAGEKGWKGNWTWTGKYERRYWSDNDHREVA